MTPPRLTPEQVAQLERDSRALIPGLVGTYAARVVTLCAAHAEDARVIGVLREALAEAVQIMARAGFDADGEGMRKLAALAQTEGR